MIPLDRVILLQTPNLGAGNLSPMTFAYIGIALAGLAVIILIGALVSRRRRPSATEAAARISSATFRREAKRMGLTPPAADVLEELVRMC